jgi:hypothetical protein
MKALQKEFALFHQAINSFRVLQREVHGCPPWRDQVQ